ncbi:MOSC domain-containing protein [Thermosulfuriphilus sp.]
MEGKVVSVNVCDKKGRCKTPVDMAVVKEGYGIEGDAHASSEWHRQVSLLAMESLRKMQEFGLNVSPGSFAENITTEGIDLVSLPLGTRLSIGEEVEIEITQIGKSCHSRCNIYRQIGDCVMPREGVFARVIKGGTIRPGDRIVVHKGRREVCLQAVSANGVSRQA